MPNPSVYGGSVTFTATVAAIPGGGTVQFNIDGADVGSPVAVDVMGEATYSTSTLTASGSPHSVIATFSGSAPYAGSVSNTLNQVVDKADQAITITMAAPVSAEYDSTFDVAATGGASGNPVVITTSGGCSVQSGGSGSATIVMTSGTTACTVLYDQAGDGNYNAAPQVMSTTTATKASSMVTVNALSVEYDGDPHPTTATVSGVGTGITQAVTWAYTDNCSAEPVNVSDTPCTATATYAGDANHTGSSGFNTITITKASSTVTVDALSVEYDGSPHSTTATVSGVGTGITQTVTWAYTDNCSAEPVNVSDTPCTATATYAGDANHTGSMGSNTITITKASSIVTVDALSVEYDGDPHPTTATVSGVGTGITQAVTWAYTDCSAEPINVSDTPCTATATYAGDANHTGSSGFNTITITKASSTVTVDALSVEYDGDPHPTTATVSGVGTGITQAVTWAYTDNCSAEPINVSDTPCTATATYAGDANHTGSSGFNTITITKASSTVTVDALSVEYDGNPHPTTAIVVSRCRDGYHTGSDVGLHR